MNSHDIPQLISGIVFVAGVIVAVVARFKYRPGEKEVTEVSVADASLDIVKGTITLVTTELEDQFKRMAQEQADQREQHRIEREELRKQHAEQMAQERRAALALEKQLSHVMDEVSTLRRSLRDAQAECDSWKRKYEEVVNGNEKKQ